MSSAKKRTDVTIIDGHVVERDPETSARLGRVRQRNTGPELRVRAVLTALGLRYRVSPRNLPGSPDIANRSGGWAIFVHGCYWHRHRGCARATTPGRNRPFWEAKFAANVARDRRTLRELRAMGFRVAVIWECQTGSPGEIERRLRGLGLPSTT